MPGTQVNDLTDLEVAAIELTDLTSYVSGQEILLKALTFAMVAQVKATKDQTAAIKALVEATRANGRPTWRGGPL